MAVDPLVVAGLDAVLKLYADDSSLPVVYQLPVWQLLSAPLANLEQRAARLRTLLAEAKTVASAESRAIESDWLRVGSRTLRGRSFAIALRPAAGHSAELAHALEQGPYPIAARVEGDSVLLDLRGVFPRWDQQLVAAVDAAATR